MAAKGPAGPAKAGGARPRPYTGEIKRLASTRGLVVVHGQADSTGLMHSCLLAPLLRGETVLLLDAANCFNPHRLAAYIRRMRKTGEEKADDEGSGGLHRRYQSDSDQSRRYGVEGCLERVRVSRAFTCFQLAELIERVPAAARRYGARRVVLTGVPDIFDDEELSDAEARAVFRRALARLRGWGPAVLTALAFAGEPAQRRPLRTQLERELFRQARGVYRLEETPAGLRLREEKALPGGARPRPYKGEEKAGIPRGGHVNGVEAKWNQAVKADSGEK